VPSLSSLSFLQVADHTATQTPIVSESSATVFIVSIIAAIVLSGLIGVLVAFLLRHRKTSYSYSVSVAATGSSFDTFAGDIPDFENPISIFATTIFADICIE
jgi:hypothetical protein